MPRMKDPDVTEFLRQPHIGVISTLRSDGMPYSVPVWSLFENDEFWISGTTNRVWCKQLQQDARCSLCIEALSPVPGFVAVDGIAELKDAPDYDIWPVTRRLVEKYVGAQGDTQAVEQFFANMQTEPRLLFCVKPQVWRAIDMRVYRGKKADRDYQEKHPEKPPEK